MTLCAAIPASNSNAPPGVRKQGYLQHKQSGAFHKTWARCFMIVKDDHVLLQVVCVCVCVRVSVGV